MSNPSKTGRIVLILLLLLLLGVLAFWFLSERVTEPAPAVEPETELSQPQARS